MQEAVTQSNSNEHDYSIDCTIFLPPIALRETKSTSNIPHVLSRILESLAKLSNILGFIKSFQCDGCQQQKRKRIQSN